MCDDCTEKEMCDECYYEIVYNFHREEVNRQVEIMKKIDVKKEEVCIKY